MKKLMVLSIIFVALSAFTCSSRIGDEIPFNAQYIRIQYFYPHLQNAITIITSTNQLKQYYNEHQISAWNGQGGELSDRAVSEIDSFFANHFIVAINLVEGSGSIRHKVENIDTNGEILIKRLLPEGGTDDMAAWSIMIELSNTFRNKQFKVSLVDVN